MALSPPRELAAVELIQRAIAEGNTALALALFEDHSPEERDRIAELIRGKLRRAARVARSRRV